ncbi:hypothetical protein GOP47_0002104 [Adiantum capillus-veneris]|uniref:Trypsin family protein n=1 Tax=Adiantum capillus-veneris TaxID=13818 RepID=A0A9D4ZQP8_ADICA|nr:hypothetical protein GOP47_0002104 [Adiantum capillus-veneris]
MEGRQSNELGVLVSPTTVAILAEGVVDGARADGEREIEANVQNKACSDSAPASEESVLDWDISLSCHGSHSKQQPREAAAGNQLTENSAAYFLWPPVCPPHGSAGERADYFKGLQKDVNFKCFGSTPSGQQASNLYELMTIRAYNSRLLRRVSLGTAVGFRTRKGVLTEIPAIIVFVARKVEKAWLHESQMLPVHLEGPGGVWCDVDVVEFYYHGVPAFTPKEQVYTELAEGLRGNDPYIGPGSQVASQETIGTLGAIVRSRTGARQVGFLTNRHVAVDLDYPSQKMFHPLPPNVGPSVYLGAVERATSFITDEGWYDIFASTNPETFVRADGAFIPFSDSFDMAQVTTAVKGVGEMGDVSVVDLQAPIKSIVGKQVTKVGRSSGLTTGTIMAYALEYNDEKGICFLTDFLIVGENQQAFDLEGDSGSLILMTEDWRKKPRPVGIIWGGTANRGRLKLRNGYGPENWTSGVDLGHLLAWLQLDLITSDTALQEAVEEQRRLKIGRSVMGDFLPKCPGSMARSQEASHHLKFLQQGKVVVVERADSLDFEDLREAACQGRELEADVPSVDSIQEIDFGIQHDDRSRKQPWPHDFKNSGNGETLLGLDLNEKIPKRRRQ